MTDPILRAAGVTHRYGERVALEDVDLAVAPGTTCALVGHNGSGKSTLLKIFAGLLTATTGEVVVAGGQPGSLPARRAVSYIGDTPILYDDLSVGEHLEFVARLHGVTEWESQAVAVAGQLGIEDRLDDLPGALSRGLRQRAAVAVALVRPFSVLLIDEPFVGLDESGRAALIALMGEAAAGGATVVIATHQLDALRHADRVVALKNGVTVFDGKPSALPPTALGDDDVV